MPVKVVHFLEGIPSILYVWEFCQRTPNLLYKPCMVICRFLNVIIHWTWLKWEFFVRQPVKLTATWNCEIHLPGESTCFSQLWIAFKKCSIQHYFRLQSSTVSTLYLRVVPSHSQIMLSILVKRNMLASPISRRRSCSEGSFREKKSSFACWAMLCTISLWEKKGSGCAGKASNFTTGSNSIRLGILRLLQLGFWELLFVKRVGPCGMFFF